MKVKDILTPEEVKEYHAQWKVFDKKNVLETKFNVHSSLPVLSPAFVYRDKPIPILRARVFQDRLRSYDPYFVATKYGNPFWHINHYTMVAEQMYHAGSNMIRDNSRLVVKDTLEGASMRIPTFWDSPHKHVSVELLLEPMAEKKATYLWAEHGHFTIYDDRKNFPIATLDFNTYAQERGYLREYHIISNGADAPTKAKAKESLIRKIVMQSVRRSKWCKDPRTQPTMKTSKLIALVKDGSVSEEALYDHFSLWDRSQQLGNIPYPAPSEPIHVEFSAPKPAA